MRALVTGATGLVGSYLCERLRADGWQVRALVRQPEAAGWVAADELAAGDVRDAAGFAAAARGCDVIFHAAAVITPHGGWEAFQPNLVGTANAVEAAVSAGARLLQVSSVAVYGPGARYRADGALVHEDLPLEPLPDGAHYARSKRESEEIALGAHRAGRAWVTAIRPCVVYGKHDRQFVPRVARSLRFGVAPMLKGGRATMTLVHAANVADAAVRAATTDAAGGRAYNVANDFPLPIADFMRLAGRGLGRRVHLVPLPLPVALAALSAVKLLKRRDGNVMMMARATVDFLTRDNPFTSDRARRELGWAPPVRHEAGVPEAFAEHRPGGAASHAHPA